MPPYLVIGNVPEMSCVLATGNLPEILPYTVPENVKEISKFPGVGNLHTMNRKCELSCTFHGISWPRKFRISSSVYWEWWFKIAIIITSNCHLANIQLVQLHICSYSSKACMQLL